MDLLKCYQVLGVPRGCTWEELRTAYRRQVQKHHPDRFQQQPEQQHLAKERMLELNKAFNTLEEYYKKNGVLPTNTVKRPRVVQPNRDQPDQSRAEAKETKPFNTADIKPTKPKQTSQKTSWSLLIVFAIMGYYFFWETTSQTDGTYSLPINTRPGQENAKLNETGTINSSEEQLPANADDPQISASPHHNDRATTSSTLAPLGMQGKIFEGPFFTYGDSPGKVFEVQGIPTRTVGDIWFYGASEVHFNKGVVVSWYSSPENPLNVK